MLSNGINKPKRIQGCFVSDAEIEELNKFLRDHGEADYNESILTFRSSHRGGMVGEEGLEEDDLYEEAVNEVIRAGKASASLLQRRLRVGYARAARLLDILEQQGVIGPPEGAKPRDVLITDPDMASYKKQVPSFNSDNIASSVPPVPKDDNVDYYEKENEENNYSDRYK
jgi:DNA segregation ATPase FtsK/SpoIIIE, S-DNA-T family